MIKFIKQTEFKKIEDLIGLTWEIWNFEKFEGEKIRIWQCKEEKKFPFHVVKTKQKWTFLQNLLWMTGNGVAKFLNSNSQTRHFNFFFFKFCSRVTRQPLFSKDKSIVSVYNGEIYNYLDLWQKYFSQNYEKFQSDGYAIIAGLKISLFEFSNFSLNCSLRKMGWNIYSSFRWWICNSFSWF